MIIAGARLDLDLAGRAYGRQTRWNLFEISPERVAGWIEQPRDFDLRRIVIEEALQRVIRLQARLPRRDLRRFLQLRIGSPYEKPRGSPVDEPRQYPHAESQDGCKGYRPAKTRRAKE